MSSSLAHLTDTAPSTDGAWQAVVARDAAADGRLVYAVRTTGIYCRPSCPSRRPRREHVRFFDGAAAARAAGFRACLRCTPDADAPPRARTADAVVRARALLDARPGDAPPLAELARAVGVSAAHLQRAFTRAVGVSPARYAAALRAEQLRGALRTSATVSRATYEAGYGASSRAYEAAAAHLGMTPAAYRRGGAGVHVWWTVADSALGRLLVAATARGVCAASFGADDDALERALAAELPRAVRERVPLDDEETDASDDAASDDVARSARRALRAWTRAIVRHVSGGAASDGAPIGDVPADAPGTPFQERVWAALRAIPAGETRSYAQVARAVGAPTAARAVARACASNRVALVIPCHRVVPAGAAGDAGGYRWGAERKRALLAREAR